MTSDQFALSFRHLPLTATTTTDAGGTIFPLTSLIFLSISICVSPVCRDANESLFRDDGRCGGAQDFGAGVPHISTLEPGYIEGRCSGHERLSNTPPQRSWSRLLSVAACCEPPPRSQSWLPRQRPRLDSLLSSSHCPSQADPSAPTCDFPQGHILQSFSGSPSHHSPKPIFHAEQQDLRRDEYFRIHSFTRRDHREAGSSR